MKQKILLAEFDISLEHGGSLSKGKRKATRPITTKKPMHLVLRSDNARGELSLLRHEKLIRTVLQEEAQRFFVELYEIAVNSNHLHLCVRAKTREGFKNFLRALAGKIARRLLKLSKLKLEKFWTETVFSRIVEWGRAFQSVKNYIIQNELEAKSVIPYKPRKQKSRAKVTVNERQGHSVRNPQRNDSLTPKSLH